jgi:hypothetical protein
MSSFQISRSTSSEPAPGFGGFFELWQFGLGGEKGGEILRILETLLHVTFKRLDRFRKLPAIGLLIIALKHVAVHFGGCAFESGAPGPVGVSSAMTASSTAPTATASAAVPSSSRCTSAGVRSQSTHGGVRCNAAAAAHFVLLDYL